MNQFKKDVIKGLSATPKKISSRYFYDKAGDVLFQKIMNLEEYYLPQCELEIINQQSDKIAKYISEHTDHVEIIELGAGDGSKTLHMLEEFKQTGIDFSYRPMDISANILRTNQAKINSILPDLKIDPIAGNYFETYPKIKNTGKNRLVLFLGGNIGNFLLDEALDFIRFMSANSSQNDYILIAFDLVKNPRKILAAYDDSKGITAEFNLNLLKRINREFGANFIVENFMHFPHYNPENGITSSHLISTKSQSVTLETGETFHFDKYETIHTEVSKKYFIKEIEYLAKHSGLKLKEWFFDEAKEYSLVLMRKL